MRVSAPAGAVTGRTPRTRAPPGRLGAGIRGVQDRRSRRSPPAPATGARRPRACWYDTPANAGFTLAILVHDLRRVAELLRAAGGRHQTQRISQSVGPHRPGIRDLPDALNRRSPLVNVPSFSRKLAPGTPRGRAARSPTGTAPARPGNRGPSAPRGSDAVRGRSGMSSPKMKSPRISRRRRGVVHVGQHAPRHADGTFRPQTASNRARTAASATAL